MTIRKKSIITVTVFVILLLINAVGLFVQINNIEKATHNLIEETKISQNFLKIKFLLKNLQEVSTDAALVGDEEGLEELKDLKSQYTQLLRQIRQQDLTPMDNQYLDNIDNRFNSYFEALNNMAHYGINRVYSYDESLNDMRHFDQSVNTIEKSIDALNLSKYDLLTLKYNIVSIQEILTDALAVGDISGFTDVDNLQNITFKTIDTFTQTYPSQKEALNRLKENIQSMQSAGKSMAKKGKTFSSMIIKTNSEMIVVDETIDSIQNSIATLLKEHERLLNQVIEEEQTILERSKNIAIVLTLLFLICVLFLAFTIKNILNSIETLNNGVSSLLNDQGITKIQLNSEDELGEISNNFNQYLKKIEKGIQMDAEVIEEANTVIAKVNAGLYNDRINKTANSQEVSKLIQVINSMIDNTQVNLMNLSQVLNDLANAKYDNPIPRPDGVTGLMASLLQGTQVTQSTINEVMALIDNSNKRLTFSANDLTTSASDLSDSSNEQAAALEQTAAAIEEVTSTIEQGTENTAKMAKYAQNVTQSSMIGIELANQTSHSMDELSEEVNTINDAITVIDQIAFQTNILSLNAAVEAATAGEAGKGFAVVAQEVRNLASRSAEAANEIKGLVESATNKAKNGKNVSNKMIEGFNELNSNINTTIEIINDVANATKEQQQAMEQINDTVNSLDHATQNNAALASNISDMAKNTQELALQLQGAVDRTSFTDDAKRRVCNTDFIFQLNKFKSDHINLKNDNFCMCKAGHTFSVKKHTECAFGKWLIENKDAEFAQTHIWENINLAHKKYHMMIQDTVDLYAEEYQNEQIFSVTENAEIQANKIFAMIDQLKEHNCDLQFKKKGA